MEINCAVHRVFLLDILHLSVTFQSTVVSHVTLLSLILKYFSREILNEDLTVNLKAVLHHVNFCEYITFAV